jgi:2-polyprenyl-3-methyl-5-hydroxy-6-metoxy-1,4-benzoquinol methylase
MKTSIKQRFLRSKLFKKLYNKTIWEIDIIRHKMKLYESEDKLASDNQKYWNRDYSNPDLAQDAHWKNKGKFEDHQRWLNLGKEHLDLILKYSSVLNFQLPVKQIVEWGCGGGANAVHFAPMTDKFIGIDITSESLDECNKQILECGFNNFHPILIDASDPESVLNKQISEVDLFICTYVFELFPSPAYGLTVLKLAYKMLKNEGIAFIHIRYNDSKKGLKPKRWGYKLHPYVMTSYSIEEFWNNSKEYGFEPLGIYLMPYQPLVNDNYYAYYFLKKIGESSSSSYNKS